jgi:hypothetical protein
MATLKPIFEAAFEKHKYNCSGFVRETAAALGFKIEGAQADNQLDFMEAHWIRLKNGIQAAEVASQGFFVVAGVKSTEYKPRRNHGHVVVIKPLSPDQLPVKKSSLYHGVYPRAWGGDIGRRYASQGDKSVGEIFNVAVRDKVKYYTPPVFGPQIQRYE